MSTPWLDVLRQQLCAPLYGYTAHEYDYKLKGRRVAWDRMFHLPWTSIEEFQYDQGRLSGVKQSGSTYDGSYQSQVIPAHKLLISTYRTEGGSAAGFPILRPAYKHWWCKDVAYTILGMAIERLIMGLLVGKVAQGMSKARREELLTILENVRAKDKMGLVLDNDIVLELLESKRDLGIVLDYINHHDVMIARAGLAQFLNLGSTEVGARSLSEDHSRIFMIAEQALADSICNSFNHQAIPALCGFNWPGMTDFPKLKHSHIRTVLKLEPVLEVLAHLVAGQLITPDIELENYIRELMDLPELAEDARPLPPPPAPAPPPPTDTPPDEQPDGDDENADSAAAKGTSPAPPAPLDDHACLAFAEPGVAAAGALFEQTQDTFQKTAGKLLEDMVTKLSKAAQPALQKIKQPFSRARLYPVLSALELPGQARYATAVRDYLQALADGGRQAAREVTGQAVRGQSSELTSYIRAQADLLAARHVAELRHVFIQQVLSGGLSGVPVAQAVADASQAARDRVQSEFGRWFRDALVAFAAELSLDLQDRSDQ